MKYKYIKYKMGGIRKNKNHRVRPDLDPYPHHRQQY